ncbi:hypothetical protein ASTA108788_08755 [Asticcacaulis taihuensis]
MKGQAFFAYATNCLIDLKYAVIVDVEASRAIRQAEVGTVRNMIERVDEHFGLYPERLAADTADGSAEMLGWLVYEKGIEPHIPVFDNLSVSMAPSVGSTSFTTTKMIFTDAPAARR